MFQKNAATTVGARNSNALRAKYDPTDVEPAFNFIATDGSCARRENTA
jgi:hypothetical protein